MSRRDSHLHDFRDEGNKLGDGQLRTVVRRSHDNVGELIIESLDLTKGLNNRCLDRRDNVGDICGACEVGGIEVGSQNGSEAFQPTQLPSVG